MDPRRLGWLLVTVAGLLQAAPAPATAASWGWPLAPRPAVAARFVAPAGPYAPGHRGVDLVAAAGASVLAPAAGTVAFVGRVAGRGVVSLDHPGGLRTTYEPVAARVSRGEPVDQGAVLGLLEPGPSHCPPATCLHWGLRRGTTYLDPLALLGPVRVRLLPVWALDRQPLPAGGPGTAVLPPGAAPAPGLAVRETVRSTPAAGTAAPTGAAVLGAGAAMLLGAGVVMLRRRGPPGVRRRAGQSREGRSAASRR